MRAGADGVLHAERDAVRVVVVILVALKFPVSEIQDDLGSLDRLILNIWIQRFPSYENQTLQHDGISNCEFSESRKEERKLKDPCMSLQDQISELVMASIEVWSRCNCRVYILLLPTQFRTQYWVVGVHPLMP